MGRYIESLDYAACDDVLRKSEWLGKAPDYDEAAITETLEADVVVCGGGLAGVAAARAAAEAGASVLLLEKCSAVQGRSSDFGVLGSRIAARWGRDGMEDRNAILNALMRAGSYFVNQQTLAWWADHSGADFDWYISALDGVVVTDGEPAPEGSPCWISPARYPELPESVLENDPYPTYQLTMRVGPTHVPVLRANLRAAEDTGLCRAFFDIPVKKLLREDGGRVYGVIAEGFDGRILKALARRGVVLATGDYSGNHDMLYYYCPWLRHSEQNYPRTDRAGFAANTGDGHRMGMWVGAVMESCPHAPISHHMGMGGVAGIAPFLQLDCNGERFMNEDCGGQELDNKINMLQGRFSWQITDCHCHEQLRYMAMRHGGMPLAADGSVLPMIAKRVEESIEKGTALRADTLEELVEKTGLPKKTALATIRRYNELAARGEDLDFGKPAKRLFPIADPPFYAARFTPALLLNCVSGLECDHNTRCYDAGGRVIPGLYACGNVQGGRFSAGYPTTVPGISHSMALTFGRLAGANAAKAL